MQLAKPRNFRCPSDMKHLSSFFHNETPLAVCTIVSSRYSGQTVTSHKAAHRIITPLSSTSKWARCLCKQAAAAAAGSGEHRLTELILRRRVSQIAVLGRAVSVGSLWWVTAGGTDSIALTSRWLDGPPAAKRTRARYFPGCRRDARRRSRRVAQSGACVRPFDQRQTDDSHHPPPPRVTDVLRLWRERCVQQGRRRWQARQTRGDWVRLWTADRQTSCSMEWWNEWTTATANRWMGHVNADTRKQCNGTPPIPLSLSLRNMPRHLANASWCARHKPAQMYTARFYTISENWPTSNNRMLI